MLNTLYLYYNYYVYVCIYLYIYICVCVWSWPGLPFAGLDDYVFMSDFINSKLDPGTLQELESSPLIGGKFSNFLNVRQNEIRLVPNNCWTRNFADYLQQTSSVVEVSILSLVLLFNDILMSLSIWNVRSLSL
jgi:hypothetical protein